MTGNSEKEPKRAPGGMIHPDPFEYDPEDFSEEPLDHGDGGWGKEIEKAQKFTQPEPWGVVYAAPNPDGSRKRCGNCMMWVKGMDACVIHKKTQKIVSDAVCGYHVYGDPMTKWMDHTGIQPVDPKFSGLEVVQGGTSCDTCIAYKEMSDSAGVCEAVYVKGNPAPVEPKGCCARWVAKS